MLVVPVIETEYIDVSSACREYTMMFAEKNMVFNFSYTAYSPNHFYHNYIVSM